MTTNFSRGISTWRFLRLCWRAPLILITCAGILTKNVEPISQAQLFLFSSEMALSRVRRRWVHRRGFSGGVKWNVVIERGDADLVVQSINGRTADGLATQWRE